MPVIVVVKSKSLLCQEGQQMLQDKHLSIDQVYQIIGQLYLKPRMKLRTITTKARRHKGYIPSLCLGVFVVVLYQKFLSLLIWPFFSQRPRLYGRADNLRRGRFRY